MSSSQNKYVKLAEHMITNTQNWTFYNNGKAIPNELYLPRVQKEIIRYPEETKKIQCPYEGCSSMRFEHKMDYHIKFCHKNIKLQ